MNKGVNTLILLIMLLFAAPAALAVTSTGHIKLLAVYVKEDGFEGSPADVQLEIKQGSGRVFLETIPLSKVDTQISTRFAKEMACKFAETDCESYDFFYTIKSPAGIVGGPSAGGAISALTVAMLLELPVDQEAAMTGTINSGELIGPVGSLKAKIDAAKEAGIKKVLIPAVQTVQQKDNETDITEYGRELGVEVVPVSTLSESVTQLTGKEFTEEKVEINIPESYTETMEKVAGELCERTDTLLAEVDVFDLRGKTGVDFEQVKLQQEARNLTQKGKDAFKKGSHYSAASYCFGANVKASTLLYDIREMTPDEARAEHARLLKQINDFDKITEKRKKETITDLQTYMIVKERILEARQHLVTGANDSTTFGYVEERLDSAVAWSSFFDQGGKEFDLDEESLEESCVEILGEVDERFQYLSLFFPGLLENLKNNLLTAHKYHQTGEQALCIYLASRTKAEANIMVSMIGVREEVVQDVIDQKILAAERAVAKQMEDGIFPIIAYSYYEYARTLDDEENAAAPLYAEYALELSDIDIYFDKKEEGMDVSGLLPGLAKYLPTFIFIWGMVLGFLLGWLVMRERRKEPKPAVKKTKKQKQIKTKTKLRLR